MSVKEQIDQDLKTAMLAGDKTLVMTLRGLKSAILYVEVAAGKRDAGLTDAEVTEVLRKEAKKRQESADLYTRGGNQEKADSELVELKAIQAYLPQQMSDDQLAVLVDQAMQESQDISPQAMGKIIGRVKELSEGNADGGRIAQAVKQRLGQA
jgi:uncharacterized protein YqeY